MNLKLSIIFSIILILSGCGSFEDEKHTLLGKTEKKDLLNAFDLSKDQAASYQETADKVEEAKQASLPQKEVVPAKQKQEKVKKEVVTKVVEARPSEPVVSGVTPYPSDYPQELKDFDIKSKPIYEKAKHLFFKGEQSIMAISYLGVTAGYITITSKDVVKIGERLAFYYYARFKSKEAYRYFYWLDDSIETFIDKNTFLPAKYSLIQREKKQNVDDLQLFDFKKLKTFHWYKRVKEGNNKDEKIENYIPRYTQDSFSALQFVRGLPFIKGDRYEFPVSTRGKAWLLKAEVMGEEIVSVNSKDIKAVKIKAETHFPGVLQKSGDILFWYSADETRKLLKFQAKVKIGSILGELVEYRPGILVK